MKNGRLPVPLFLDPLSPRKPEGYVTWKEKRNDRILASACTVEVQVICILLSLIL